ncbi:MAG: hypothetical protein ACTSX1_13825 [Candidatus Heimdallarchaeaceae archaeon]
MNVNCEIKDLRQSKNCIFTMMQDNDAWKLSTGNDVDSFYTNNVDEIVSMQRKYAETIGVNYHFYRGDIVGFVKSRIPNLPELRLFVQYYDIARYLLLDILCSYDYDKALYLDTDIIPITDRSLFPEIQENNSLYIHGIPKEDGLLYCDFHNQMDEFNKTLKDESYEYNGNVNHGVMGCRGNGARTFLKNHTDEIIKFTEIIDSAFETEYHVYIGLEHYYCYMMGTREPSDYQFNLNFFKEKGWNIYVLDHKFPKLSDLYEGHHGYKLLHFCGGEAKKFYEKNKDKIRKLVKSTIGEY